MRKTQPRRSEMSSRSEDVRRTHRTYLTPGKPPSYKLVLYVDIPNYPISFALVSTLVYHISTLHLHLLIAPQLLNIPLPLTSSYRRNSSAVATLVHSRKLRSKKLWVPSNHHPWPSSRNLIASMHTGYSKTYRFRTHPRPSITRLTPIFTHAYGAPSRWYVLPSGVFLPALRPPYVMWLRLTVLSQSPLLNGQASSLNYRALTPTQLILAARLAYAHPVVATVMSEMLGWTLCVQLALALCLNGQMIMYFSAYLVNISQNITNSVRIAMPESYVTVPESRRVVATGTRVTSCLMDVSRNSMTTTHFPYLTSRHHLRGLLPTLTTPTPSQILTHSRSPWVSLGNPQRTFPSVQSHLSSASNGTWPLARSRYYRRNARSTWQQLRRGRRTLATRCERSKASTANSCMLPQSWLVAEPTLQSWNQCWPSTVIVHSYHAPHPSTHPMISTGGRTSSPALPHQDQSQGLARFLTLARSQMLAPQQGSVSSLEAAGEPGGSSRVGKATQVSGTLAGQKPLDSSSSFALPLTTLTALPYSRSSVTTEASSRVGGRVVAETGLQISSFDGYSSSSMTTTARFSPDMSLAPPTQPTAHREGDTHPAANFSRLFLSHLNSNHSSSTSTPTIQPSSTTSSEGANYPVQIRNPFLTPQSPAPTTPTPSLKVKPGGSTLKRKAGTTRTRWNAPGSPQSDTSRTLSSSSRSPLPSAPNPQLHLSPLRPHCLARERLRLWRPIQARNTLDARGYPTNLSLPDLERIKDVLTHAWAESTRETYGAGLLVWHIFCDMKLVPEEQRAPASNVLLHSFVATIAGYYSGSTISNFIHGIRAWHILHGVGWSLDKASMDSLLKAASNLAPASSKRKQRQPWTVDFLETILSKLDPNDPLHIAVESCLTTTFYTTARLGEFTLRTLSSFDPQIHVTPSDVFESVDREGLKTTGFRLPKTKTGGPEVLSWSAQHGRSDPRASLERHLRVNSPPRDGPLFAYRYKDGHRPLTKAKVLQVARSAAKSAGLDPLQGHGIRIGSTLEYLLRGMPFDVMKVQGRWASDSFTLYLRKHAQILAPYLQAVPLVHEAFTRYTMPRVR